MKMNRMVTALSLAALSLCLMGVPQAHATFFGQMGPLGASSEHGLEMLGGYVGFATDVIGAFGQARIGMGNMDRDLGFEVGWDKVSNGGPSSFGGLVDYKMALFRPSATNKDLKIGGDIAVMVDHTGSVGNFGSETGFGASAVPIISYTSASSKDQSFSIWGGLGIQIEHTSVSTVTIDGVDYGGSSTDTNGIFRVGAGYNFTKDIGLAAELNDGLKTGSTAEFTVGLNFFGVAKKK